MQILKRFQHKQYRQTAPLKQLSTEDLQIFATHP